MQKNLTLLSMQLTKNVIKLLSQHFQDQKIKIYIFAVLQLPTDSF